MKKSIKNVLLMAVALLFYPPHLLRAQVSNNNEDEVYKMADARRAANDFVPGEVLVKFKDAQAVAVRRVNGRFKATAKSSEVSQLLQEYGVDDMEQVLQGAQPRRQLRSAKAPGGGYIQERDLSQLYRLRMSQPDRTRTMQLAQRLEEQAEVEFAEPNYKAYIMAEVDHGETIATNPDKNSQYPLQWGIPEMKINELWTKPIVNGTRPVIAIIDTGVDTTHPDLAANCVAGYDFVNETSEVRDNNMHGTHVAGIAAACDNGIGIIGANPRALIMPVAVMQSDGSGDIATIIRGIDFAAQNGATVINMSLGTYANSAALRQSLANAYQNCVLVAAAGNDGHSMYPLPHPLGHCLSCSPAFPAAYSFVLGVQATMQGGERASFSNYDPDGPNYSEANDPYGDEGLNYELKAPGVSILSTVPNGGYRQLNGTSMAAPLVAGAVSALKMVKEYESQEVLWGDLLHTSDFLAAYNVTDRPAELEVLGLQFDDRQDLVEGENNVSSDGRIDAGETIKLYPVLRTTFGDASNIKLHLEVAEFEDASVVTITQNDVDFGYHLSAYGKNVSENPLVFKTKGNVADGRHIRLKLTATCDGVATPLEHDFTIIVDNVTKIGGTITKDMTLTADKNYLVSTNLAIMEGASLTIQPGTTVRFCDNTGISVADGGHLIAKGEPGNMITFTRGRADSGITSGLHIPNDTIEYAVIEDIVYYDKYQDAALFQQSSFKNCIFRNNIDYGARGGYPYLFGDATYIRTNIVDNGVGSGFANSWYYQTKFVDCNIVGNYGDNLYSLGNATFGPYSDTQYCNIFDFEFTYSGQYDGNILWGNGETSPKTFKSETPSYYGSGREDIVRQGIWDIQHENGNFGYLDLSNMPTRPYAEAHGIVWKVCVNGKDAQDEFEDMLPLGTGRHKFEVYYNRPMNKAVAPNIAFGVREPYTQNAVNEDGTWNEDGTIYTAYVTITNRTATDGLNRIYVYGGEDDEFFECPYEKTRFNVNIQAAGSMSTGFMAEGGSGCVCLSWNKSGADGIDDAMGYNIYRYTERVRYEEVLDEFGNKIWDDETDDWQKREIIERDTLRINPYVLDVDQESYVDMAVTPGETYYYYYKLQGTNMKEYGMSNVMSATPLDLLIGDVNGDNNVDVFDIVAVANYIMNTVSNGFNAKAADANSDGSVDVFDIVKIANIIMQP